MNGTTNLNFNVWYSFMLKKIGLECNPGLWMSFDNRFSLYNNQKVRTNNIWSSFNISFDKSIDSLLQSSLEFNLTWNQGTSDNPNVAKTNNLNWKISTSQELQLPWKMKLKGEFDFNIIPSNAAFAGSQTYSLLNASIEKSLLHENALTARLSVYDILGQNRSISRSFYQNNISETISQALTRYVMFTMIYKFKNKSKKNTDESQF